MSISAETPVFEAELVDGPVNQVDSAHVNPYASPSTTAAAPSRSLISEGVGRASQEKIDRVINHIVNAESAFVAVCFVSAMPWLALGSDIGTILLILWLGTLLYAAYCFARMVEETSGSNFTTFLMIISFLVPVFGTLIFFAGKRHAFRFLIWNGYGPGFLGAQPDDAEIAKMNADPHYRPSPFRTCDGLRRVLPFSLSSFGIPVYALVRLTFMWLQL